MVSKKKTEEVKTMAVSPAEAPEATKVSDTPKAAKKAKAAIKGKPDPGAKAKHQIAAKPRAEAAAKTAASKPAKSPEKPKKAVKAKGTTKSDLEGAAQDGTAKILDSQVVFEGPLFRVTRDHIVEPEGRESRRDVIRHNGSVVILAIDHGKNKRGKGKKNPWIVIERQYRHAAGQYLWELPAGKLDAGEAAVDGAKRELAEETGYQAKKWTAAGRILRQPGLSRRIDEGLSGRRPDRRRRASRGG